MHRVFQDLSNVNTVIKSRKQLVHKIVDKYKPVCNQINEDSENVPTSTARTIEQEPEPEEAKDDLLDELKKKTGEEQHIFLFSCIQLFNLKSSNVSRSIAFFR